MTGPPLIRRPVFDWEAAGREVGETLGAYTAIVVIGSNPVATGRAAVGIARAQAMHRRTALGDLFAESPPIQALVHTDDPHGLVDCFLYGVSITKIAYEVPDSGQLFVMPSGTEAPPYAEILPNPRWARLAAGFREMKALLVLAAPASAPRLSDLIAVTDGAVLVGDIPTGALPDIKVLGAVREPRAAPMARRSPSASAPAVPPATKWSRARIAGAAGIALTLALAGAAAWLAYRPFAGPTFLSRRRGVDSAHPIARGVPKLDSALRDTGSRDSTRRDSVRPDSAPPSSLATLPELLVANPADSSQAAAFGIELIAYSTQAGAISKLQKDGKDFPTATFGPVMVDGVRWFQFITGAYVDRSGADTLLASLKKRNFLRSGERVVRLPFAFRIDSGVPAAAVPRMVAAYVEQGQPVYALRQPDGSAWLLVGAFASAEQASLFTESIRASNHTPVLVYRKGRMF